MKVWLRRLGMGAAGIAALVVLPGRTPEGKQLDPNIMPWQAIGTAQPHELEAIWAYLQTVPAKATPAAE